MALIFRILGIIFFPLTLIHTLIIFVRNKLFDWGFFHSCQISTPVISIGNIQLGGTGKTPFTEYVVQKLLQFNLKPVILTRGYRRKDRNPVLIDPKISKGFYSDQIGDEPYLLSRNLPGVTIGIDADRCRMAKKIYSEKPESVFVLDDGFQHRKLTRDVDIVLLDPTRWSKLPFLFPLTYFRDLKSSLTRAHIFIITRWKSDPEKSWQLKRKLISRYQKPVFLSNLKPIGLQNLNKDEKISLEEISQKKVIAFCGLASPHQFFKMLEENNARIVGKRVFKDHHYYNEREINSLIDMARKFDAEYIITTQKDAVKIRQQWLSGNQDFYYVRIIIQLDDEEKFINILMGELSA